MLKKLNNNKKDKNAPIRKRSGYTQMIVAIFIFIALFLAIIAILLILEIWIIGNKSSNSFVNNTSFADSFAQTKSKPTSTSPNKFKWRHCGQTYIAPNIDPSIHESPHNDEQQQQFYETSSRSSQRRNRFRRIIGGEDAVAHSFPFLVSVRVLFNSGSEHHCGGIYIVYIL